MKKFSALVLSIFFVLCGQAHAKDTLYGGEYLYPGDKLVSSNGKHELLLASNGSLQLRQESSLIWSSMVHGSDNWRGSKTGNTGIKAVMQASDGNFVVYSSNNGPIWSTFKRASFDNKNSKLILQNDGNLVIYKPDMTPIWHSGTVVTPKQCTTKKIDMWGGKVQDGYIWNTNTRCTVYVPLLPSSNKVRLPYNGQLCEVKPAYAGKRNHTTCK
ncbi:hypothetical protein [Microbulbifer sp. TRSA007]|uniref:hypothetical protein n=1 Tax=Microbulbifer sp. TRSA007 TaxID=3243384 RepID=UPI004039DD9E